VKKLYPAAEDRHVLNGSGPLDSRIGNTVSGKPAKDGSITFVFACTGPAAVSVVVNDHDTPIPGSQAQIMCGKDGIAKTVDVTTKSALSFRAKTTAPVEGAYAYAWIGDIQ
jgi:hypothetical protein